MFTRKNTTYAALTTLGLVCACSFGAEVVLISGAPDLDGAFGVAATLDGATVFTADGDNILTAFTPAGGTTDWEVDGADPLVAITVDPATTNGIRVLRQSGIVTTRVSAGQIVDDRGVVPLPSGAWSTLCDLSADADGDLYFTGVEAFVWGSTVYTWAELHRYDAGAGTWSQSVYLGPDASCPRVSVDTDSDHVAVLRAEADQLELRHKDTLGLVSALPGSQATDVDMRQGNLLLSRSVPGQGRHVRIIDGAGTTLAEEPLTPEPSAVHLSLTNAQGLRAYVVGEDMLTYFPVYAN